MTVFRTLQDFENPDHATSGVSEHKHVPVVATVGSVLLKQHSSVNPISRDSSVSPLFAATTGCDETVAPDSVVKTRTIVIVSTVIPLDPPTAASALADLHAAGTVPMSKDPSVTEAGLAGRDLLLTEERTDVQKFPIHSHNFPRSCLTQVCHHYWKHLMIRWSNLPGTKYIDLQFRERDRFENSRNCLRLRHSVVGK